MIEFSLVQAKSLITKISNEVKIDDLSVGTIRQLTKIVEFIDQGGKTRDKIFFSPIKDGCLSVETPEGASPINATIHVSGEDSVPLSIFDRLLKTIAELVRFIPTSESLQQRMVSCTNRTALRAHDNL